MNLPRAYTVGTYSNIIQEFGGYNHNLRISDNQFYDMLNMTSDYYPVLSTRPGRGYIRKLVNPTGFYTSEALVWVEDGKLYYDSKEICELSGDKERSFVPMGAYLCIFPDKKILNISTMEVEDMEAEYVSAGEVKYTLTKLDATPYDTEKIHSGETAPSDTSTYPYWYDTNENSLKMWNANYNSWSVVGTTYIKIESKGIGSAFKENDAVTIAGSSIPEFNASNLIISASDDFIVVAGLISGPQTQTEVLTIKREVPDMDFICESGNRLWGCSSEKHEIYASVLGDPKNWNVFQGLSSDSYAATVGTGGEFTGCISHLGYVLFFKENMIHKVYGSVPSNFQITEIHCRGVQKGSHKSLTLVSETLFYKSRDGVCMYDGSMPVSISECLGKTLYQEAVGAQLNDKYYLSMRDQQDEWKLFVYDAAKAMWHVEDNTHVLWFGYYYGGLYFVNDSGEMYLVNNEYEDNAIYPGMDDFYPDVYYPNSTCTNNQEQLIPWMFETGDIGLETIENKYINKINIRLYLEEGSTAEIYVQYDSGDWELINSIMNTDKKNYVVPIITRRCDHMRIRIEGYGDAKLYSFQKVTEKGSEVNGTS